MSVRRGTAKLQTGDKGNSETFDVRPMPDRHPKRQVSATTGHEFRAIASNSLPTRSHPFFERMPPWAPDLTTQLWGDRVHLLCVHANRLRGAERLKTGEVYHLRHTLQSDPPHRIHYA